MLALGLLLLLCGLDTLLVFGQTSRNRYSYGAESSEESEESEECQFSRDCQKVCGNVQDAACLCVLGKCKIDGRGFFGYQNPSECSTYKDCPCKGSPLNCFCKFGQCVQEPRECRKNSDCKRLNKCKNQPCGCTSGNLCESDCITADDCVKKNLGCATIPGYKCKCESNLCKLARLPSQCNNIKDCVKKGKCTSSEPCSCTNNQCVDPWFVGSAMLQDFPGKNCRYPESKFTDCTFSVADCEGDRCDCTNPVNVTKYEKWGKCSVKN